MKKIFITSMIAFLSISCMTSYYQVYKTSTSDKINYNENLWVFEDQNCTISYNFWDDGGNIGFRFFNKTDKNIYLNLEESFYVFNGTVNDYFKNRVFTDSHTTGSSSTNTGTFGKSVTGINYRNMLQTNLLTLSTSSTNSSFSGNSIGYTEKKIVCIPPKTHRDITEYKINQVQYFDCDLPETPNSKKQNSKSFTRENSPFTFGNLITYKVGENDNSIKIENNFYVSEIANLTENEMYEFKNTNDCGKKSAYKDRVFKKVYPNQFYIKYNSTY